MKCGPQLCGYSWPAAGDNYYHHCAQPMGHPGTEHECEEGVTHDHRQDLIGSQHIVAHYEDGNDVGRRADDLGKLLDRTLRNPRGLDHHR